MLQRVVRTQLARIMIVPSLNLICRPGTLRQLEERMGGLFSAPVSSLAIVRVCKRPDLAPQRYCLHVHAQVSYRLGRKVAWASLNMCPNAYFAHEFCYVASIRRLCPELVPSGRFGDSNACAFPGVLHDVWNLVISSQCSKLFMLQLNAPLLS